MGDLRPERFLIVSTEFPPGPGGIGQHAWSVSKALEGAGHEVIAQTEADYSDSVSVSSFDEVHLSPRFSVVRNVRNGWLTYLNRISTLIGLIKHRHPDVLIVSGRFSIWAGALVKCSGYSLPIWAFIHGSEVGNPNRWSVQLTQWLLRRMDRLIAVSSFTRSVLPELLQHQCEVIPNGILGSELPSPDKLEGFREWKGSPKLLTVGSVSLRKGQHRVIRALPALLRLFPQVHYHMVGLDRDKESLVHLAKSLGVNGHITFHGKLAARHDLYRAYRSADLFIMLSENQPDGDVEGFGIAILEANHFGLPAIGARGCGIEEAIDHGHTGYLVDGNDSEAIARAVQEAFNKRKDLGVLARQWAAAHDWNLLVQRLLRHEAR